MSKMDRQLNSKKDKETIYEIYRACRLCGAGAGYKMPIIQNVVDIDDTEVELRQKVRDCVQIEVHQNDKMPPLICELCVDKVNDFYEFLEMCRQTNKRTRLRLGLPPQSMPRGAPDAGECILGLTEPVYVNDDSDAEPMSKQKRLNPSSKVKREPELLVKLENRILTDTRTSRLSKRSPTPPRVTRLRANSKDDNVSLSRLKDKSKSPKVTPKSILKKDMKVNIEDSSPLSSRLKRSRDKEPIKLETPTKKVKIATKLSPPTPKSSPKTSPRVTRPPKPPKATPKRAPSPPRLHKCAVCGQTSKTPQANISHMKVHFVNFTSRRLACNPCGLWFASIEEASTHHKNHKNKSLPYTCSRCATDYKHLSTYDDHFKNNQCIPWEEVPDVKCDVCWHLFPTNKLLDDHRCLGEDHRPGGKCGKCNRSYALLRNLKKHELTCTAKKKGGIPVDPALLSKCRPLQIRTSRCDSLLTNPTQEHYDVSNVSADFGLDRNCVYPYITSVSRLRIKSDPEDLDRMVSIEEGIKDEFYTAEDYIHWDSEDTGSDEEGSCSLVLNPFAKKKNVSTLANISLKTLFSQRCLGKVPKKKRRVKEEKSIFDSLNETEDDVTRDINNIIDNLGDDDVFDNESGDGNPGNREAAKHSVIDKESNDTNKTVDISDDTNSNINVDKDVQDSRNDVQEKNDENAQSDVKISDVNDISDEVSKENDKDSATINFNSLSNNTIGSNNNLSSINDNNDEITRIDDKFNNVTINSTTDDDNDTQATRKKENDPNINDNSLESGKDENQNDGTDMRNDVVENSQDSSSVGAVSESILNDSTQSDVGSENEKESIDKVNINTINDNATSLPEQNSDVDEFKSQPNLFSTAILSSKISAIDVIKSNDRSQNNDDQSEVNDDHSQVNDDHSQVNDDYSQVNDSEDSFKNTISVIVSNKSKNGTDDDLDLDDSKLMADLDAQIGESNDNSRGQVNDNSNDKIALEDLISIKSQEIDTIPEHFNFDA